MPTLQVRDVPEPLYRKIVALAKAERRSITQETIVLLEKALQVSSQDTIRRQGLLDQILREEREGKYAHLPDPVSLIREDRER